MTDASSDHNPLWSHKANCAFPCATQNEINENDAKNLLKTGVILVSEGANMPTTAPGVELFLAAKILYGPGQGSQRRWRGRVGPRDGSEQHALQLAGRDEVDSRSAADHGGHPRALAWTTAERFGTPGNYVNGANIAGFLKVADSMIDQGLV